VFLSGTDETYFAVKRFITLVLLVLWMASATRGQDVIYSQFHNAPILVSPGLTGVFNGDVRLSAIYANQWNTVPVNANSFTAGADMRFLGKKPRKGFFAAGLLFHFDQGGFIGYYNTAVSGLGSYTHRLGRHIYGTVGVKAGMTHQGYNRERITLDEHYDPITGLPVISPGNGGVEDFPNQNATSLDLGAGFNLRIQMADNYELIDRKEERTVFDIGFGMFHLNRAPQSLTEVVEDPSAFRLSPYVFSTIQIGRRFDLLANARIQFQEPHSQYMLGAGLRWHISTDLGKQLALQVMVASRFQEQEVREAIIPMVEVHYNDFQLGFSYDANISDFTVATDGFGGPQISLSYIFKRVRPLPLHKTCPLI